jgi:transposase
MSGGMLIPPGPIRVLMATKPVDFRQGMNGLAALVKEQLKADPFSGTIYVFRSKRADRVKLLFWDGSGVCLFAKRLEGGKFCWPRVEDGVMRLSAARRAGRRPGLEARACSKDRSSAGRTIACDEMNHPQDCASQMTAFVFHFVHDIARRFPAGRH